MAVDQLPRDVREFTNYLDGLLARLDQGGGWCGVFWQRDPEGMRACLDGRELPPWDVMEALLQDLAGTYGPHAAAQEKERAHSLHAAALIAYDARPGGRDALGDRLDVMLREQKYALERQAELGRMLAGATTQADADALRVDLAWARDDHDRATARCAELRSRMAELDRRAGGGQVWDTQAIRRGSGGSAGGSAGWDAGTRGYGHHGAATLDHPQGEAAVHGHATHAPAASDHYVARGSAAIAHRGQPSAEASAYATQSSAAAPAYGTPALEAAAYGTRPPRGPLGHGARTAVGAGPAGHGAPASRTPDHRAPQHHAPGAEHTVPHRTDADELTLADPGPTERVPADLGPTERNSAEPSFTAPDPSAPTPAPVPKQRKRRRGGARFAGMVEEEAAASVVPPEAAVSVQPSPSAATGRSPRGARFAGAAEAAGPQERRGEADVDDGVRRETVEAVRRLVGLRAESRSGEAHALLVEIAYWPAARFPLLAAELQHAGLGADWATLLWEAASLPADRLVAAADALAAAGRTGDGEQILRQGVARPAGEIGEAVLGLAAEGRRREVRALLDAYVRVRTPEEAARSADADPETLVPLLVEAARGVSDERHWDLVHALRVAGHTA